MTRGAELKLYMSTIRSCVLLWTVVAFSPVVWADDNAAANKLMVQAVKLVESARNEPSTKKQLDLVRRAQSTLQQIVENHPSSDLAVKLITGQPIGDISLQGLRDATQILTIEHVIQETEKFVQASEDESSVEKKLDLIVKAERNLQEIETLHSSMDLRMLLLADRSSEIGRLREAVHTAERNICQQRPSRTCILRRGLAVANSILITLESKLHLV